jgi:hypothetical protein
MKPRMKKVRPQDTAIIEINLMNLSISMAKGVSDASAVCARFAI